MAEHSAAGAADDGESVIGSIGNGLVKCEVRTTAAGLTWTLTSEDDARWMRLGPSGLPRLEVDGRLIGWRRWASDESTEGNGSATLRVSAEDDSGGLRLSRFYQVFPGQPFVRTWGSLENVGERPIRISDADILNLSLSGSCPFTLFHVEQFSWVYRPDFFSQNQHLLRPNAIPAEVRMGSFPSRFCGPTSCAWAAMREGTRDWPGEVPSAGRGMVLGIEFNGKSRLRAWADEGTTHATSTIDDLGHRLDPNQSFDIPASFVGLFTGDWDEAGYVTQRFAEAWVHPPMPDERYPWVQYNTWGYGEEIDEAQQMEAVERCGRMGVEVFVLDLGWAERIGDWWADPDKFPRGLSPIADRCHELGMKFGVHIPLAQANLNSRVAREHPGWLASEVADYFGAAPLCLGHDPCREWLIGEMVGMIDRYAIDYIVHDGEDMVKRCVKDTHTHTPGNSNYANSTLGLDIVVETVRGLRPPVIWENCADGGTMLTYKMARNYHSTITVDNIATYATRQGVYGASYPFSPRYSVRYMQDDPTPYTLRSAILGGPLILMQRITEWDEAQMAQTAQAIEEYVALREIVRDAKVVHLLPPRHNVDGIGWGWDAIQAVSADRARSIVMVYRALGGPAAQTVRPRGLDSAATYRVRFTDRGDTLEMTGDQLARDGVGLALAELSSEVLRLER
jgi:hypothetical protein